MHTQNQKMSVPEFGEEGKVYDLQVNFIAMNLGALRAQAD